ncbi:MAG: glycosyltransferase family 4 protein [Novosphingobium sp.]|nr:glycosyltransferase family 4 protein [Novosphingobium sp.]
MHVLHLHSSFQTGGKELRAARLINVFGAKLRHSIVSAMPDALGAASAIDTGIEVDYPSNFPLLAGKPWPGRLWRLAQAMKPFDLVLSYNWGAMDAVLSHSVFRDYLSLPPLVHHEDGFNEDEANGLKRSRNWYRQVALARSAALVVPSRRLEGIALEAWKQPRGKVKLITNGIATSTYRRKLQANALPRIVKRKGELWLGTLAGLRQVKDLPRLVRAFSRLPEPWQLVILGEGPEREAIRAEAMRLELSHRVHLPGFVSDPAKAVGLFDLFALSSQSEQFPISVVEAMAAGLAVASPDVGDVAGIVSPENRPFVTSAGDEDALANAIEALAGDAALRKTVGKANRALATAKYDEKSMIAAYRAVYGEALGLPEFP